MRNRGISVVLFLLWVIGCAGTGAEEQENYFTDVITTPHIAWCKPYAKGKIKAVVLAPATSVRRIMEIGQRIDLDIAGTTNYDRPEAVSLVKGTWDVCILSDVNTRGLLPETRYWILKNVMAGRGLIIINPKYQPTANSEFSAEILKQRGHNMDAPEFPPDGLPVLPDGKDFLLRTFPANGLAAVLDFAASVKPRQPRYFINSWMDPWKKLPEYKDSRALAESCVSTCRMGNGRAVNIDRILTLTEETAFDFGKTRTAYDYAVALVANAVLWALPESKRPDVKIMKVSEPALLRAGETAGSKISLVAANRAGESKNVTVRAVLRDENGVPTDMGNTPCTLSPGTPQELSFRLPALPAGRYCVDFFVDGDRGREMFGSGSISVTSESGIVAIEPAQDYVERGETLTGKVTLRKAVAGDKVTVAFVDNGDRIITLVEQTVKDPAKPVSFSFTAQADTTQIVRIRAGLVRNGRMLEEKEARFTVPRRGKDSFSFIVWVIKRGILGYYAGQQMKAAGVTAILDNFYDGYRLSECAANDLMAVPYVTHVSGWTPKDQPGRAPEKYDGYYGKPASWNNDALRTLEINWRVDAHRATRQHGVFAYSLGDEIETRYVDDSPECMAVYRQYLKTTYGTIDDLNRTWEEQYRSFDEIHLLKEGDVWEKDAFERGRYPRWVDRQLFAYENMMMVARQYRKTFPERLNDPQAVCGFEGLGIHDHDYLDFDGIMASTDWWMPYRDGTGTYNNILRSLQPARFPSGNWVSADPASYWGTFMSGLHGYGYWCFEIERPCEPYVGFFAPAYNFHPQVGKMVDDMKPVRDGLGDLIIQSTQEHEPIAVYYSIEAALASTFKANVPFGTLQTEHRELISLLHDLGYEFQYVTGKQVADDVLRQKKYRILFLPCIQALPEGAASRIRQFVHEGGVLVADMRPGIFDGHGRSVSPGMLDDVFGVRRLPEKSAAKTVRIQCSGPVAGREIAAAMDQSVTDAGYEPAGAVALGNADGIPVFFVNTAGTGTAILLNYNLAGAAPAFAKHRLIGNLLTLAGIQPGIRVTGDDGQSLLASQTARWKTGEGRIVGIMLNPLLGRKSENGLSGATLTLPTPAHVYDIREGKYLGNLKEILLRMQPSQPKILGLLPYFVDGVELNASAPTVRQGERLALRVILKGAPANGTVLHPIHTEFINPNGENVLLLERKTLIKGGKGEIVLQTAFNEQPGKWLIRTTDILTGRTATASFQVVARR